MVLVHLVNRGEKMRASIIFGVSLFALVGCASNEIDRNSTQESEPREYATGSNLPRRGPADAKQVDKDGLRDSLQQTSQPLGRPG
jgi:hypothetical protein